MLTRALDAEARRARVLADARALPVAPAPATLLRQLVDAGLADPPLPGAGHTLERWRALADVAAHDLSLAKLFEGHADALAILHELGDDAAGGAVPAGATWGMWAAEPPDARVVIDSDGGGRVTLNGRKSWCSGAASISHALMTTWRADGTGPWLVKVALRQPNVRVTGDGWSAVGMAGSASVDVVFDGALGERVGGPRDYLDRPGFWHGGAGIAACWFGGARALGDALRRAVSGGGDNGANPLRRAALGKVDLALQGTAALLREGAAWIDAHPHADASAVALRLRLSAEQTARGVLDEVGRALGAAPFCRDPWFARMAADLPVFTRQSHAERDFAALGERLGKAPSPNEPTPQNNPGDSSWRL